MPFMIRPTTQRIPLSADAPAFQQVSEVIETDYDIGDVFGIEQLLGGYTNLSYAVYSKRNGRPLKHFFRRYKRGVTAQNVRFESALIEHIASRSANVIAGVIRTKENSRYVRRLRQEGERYEQYFYALFDFIGGEDKYSWTNNQLSQQEFASAGASMARMHNAACGYVPDPPRNPRATISEVIDALSSKLHLCLDQVKDNDFDSYFLSHYPLIQEITATTRAGLTKMDNLPRIAIHGDFHPGNQKYLNDEVEGIFDFDRTTIDLRLYDVALGIVYFCSSWDLHNDGELDLESFATFLGAYQQRSRELADLGPMSSEAIAHFPRMMAAANLMLIKWATVDTFYNPLATDEYDPREYLSYLQHNIRLMYWIEEHQSSISEVLKNL